MGQRGRSPYPRGTCCSWGEEGGGGSRGGRACLWDVPSLPCARALLGGEPGRLGVAALGPLVFRLGTELYCLGVRSGTGERRGLRTMEQVGGRGGVALRAKEPVKGA